MILDSDVLIDLLRNRPSAVAWFAGLTVIPPVCGVAVLETTFGALNAADLKRIDRFLSRFPIEWPDASDMRQAHQLASLKLSNGIGVLDAVTAAVALRLGEEIATFNVKHFVNVPGVVTVQPYIR